MENTTVHPQSTPESVVRVHPIDAFQALVCVREMMEHTRRAAQLVYQTGADRATQDGAAIKIASRLFWLGWISELLADINKQGTSSLEGEAAS